MSSILKALKKIEGRKVETRLPVWQDMFGGSGEAMDNQIHRSRNRQKILTILVILCVVAIGLKFYLGRGGAPEDGTPSRHPVPKAETTSSPAKAEEPAVATAESTPAPPTPAASTDTPASLPEVPEETAPAVAIAASTPPPAEATETPANISSESAPPAETETPTPSPAAAPAEPQETETFDQAPANNAGLALHALVWSTQKEKRFVVINGNILREGDTIEGAEIVRIEKDYVVMKSGAGVWRFQ